MAPWTTAEGERGKNWSHDRPSVLILVGLLVTIPSTIFIFTRTRCHSWANSFVMRSGRNNRSKKTWLPLIATEIRIRFDNFSGERTSPNIRETRAAKVQTNQIHVLVSLAPLTADETCFPRPSSSAAMACFAKLIEFPQRSGRRGTTNLLTGIAHRN